jgi:flagellar basal body-associated protein FliL
MADDKVSQIMSVLTGQNAMILVIIMIIFVIVAVGGGFFAWWIARKLLYNQKVILFKKINGRFEPIKNFSNIKYTISKSVRSNLYSPDFFCGCFPWIYPYINNISKVGITR